MSKKIYEVAEKYFSRKGDSRRVRDIIQNMRPDTVDGKPCIGTAMVPVDMLRFPSYQADRLCNLNEEKIMSISSNFDLRRSGCIELVPNIQYGSFDVADGMGRTIAAEIAGIEYIRANIHLGIPQSEVERYGAGLYADQYDGVRPMKPCHQRLAKIILGDPCVTSLDQISKQHNVILIPTLEDKKSRRPHVKSYSDAMEIVKVNGKEGLDWAYRVIKSAGWDIETYGYASYVLRTLKFIYQVYGHEKGIVGKFGGILRQYSPTGFKEAAHLKYPDREPRTACVLYADDILSTAIGQQKRLYYAGNKIQKSA